MTNLEEERALFQIAEATRFEAVREETEKRRRLEDEARFEARRLSMIAADDARRDARTGLRIGMYPLQMMCFVLRGPYETATAARFYERETSVVCFSFVRIWHAASGGSSQSWLCVLERGCS